MEKEKEKRGGRRRFPPQLPEILGVLFVARKGGGGEWAEMIKKGGEEKKGRRYLFFKEKKGKKVAICKCVFFI